VSRAVVIRPIRDRDKRDRYFVAGRLAWFYPLGTVIEHRGERWLCVKEWESFRWWRRQGLPASKGSGS
jgi:hypothetical protein